MRYKSKIITFIKIISWFVFFFLGFFIISSSLNYIYQDTDEYERILWHSFYGQEEIDTINIGSSHVFCSIIPTVLDTLNSDNNFNLSTSSQTIRQSYLDLVEANGVYDIKNANVEVCYNCSSIYAEDDNDIELKRMIGIYVRSMMNPIQSILSSKFNMDFHLSDNVPLVEEFLPFVMYRKYLFDWDYINEILEKKNGENYQNYKYYQKYNDNNGIGYTDLSAKGFYKSTRIMQVGDRFDAFQVTKIPEEMTIREDEKYFLHKIIDYCKKNDINLVLFIAPIYSGELLSTEDYDKYITSINEIAEKEDIPFYDFNLCRTDFFDTEDESYYMNSGHLNAKGAEAFTPIYYSVISGNDNDSNCFYSSYSEKMADIEPKIYGAYIRNISEDNKKRSIIKKDNVAMDEQYANTKLLYLAINRKDLMEFKIYVNKDYAQSCVSGNEEGYLYQDFSDNNVVKLSNEDTGTCTIIWRLKKQPEITGTLYVNY